MRPGTTLSVYTTSWSLLTNPIHENRGHSICLYNTMVSSHQLYSWDHGPLYLSMQHHDLFSPIPFHTWDQGPLYLSIQHHGLLSTILYMRPGTTLSVYTTPWSLLTNPIHENRDHSICLCNTVISSHQSHTWEQGPLYLSIKPHGLFSPTLFMRPWTTLSVYTTSWSLLTNPIYETRDHSICLYNTMVSSHQSHTWDQWPLYLSIQHRLFSPIPYMRTGTTLSVYTTPWSLLTNPIHENRDHSICLYNTMISSHQSHTWEQGPLYLSIKPHGLFSPTLFMRPWTTLSVYTTSWSLLTNPIHETRDHSICLYNTMVSSYQSHTWEQGALYLSIQHHGLFSPILFMRPGTTLCLYNTMVSSHQSHTWEQGPLYLSIQHHGLFSPIIFMRPGTTLSLYTTSWSLLTNHIHENRDHSICLYNTVISSHQSHTWEQGPLYLSTTTPWSLLTNPIHENRDHSICLYNTMVSSYQSHTWEQGALYLSIQHHGLFSPILFMRPGTTLCLYNTMVSSHQSHTWEQGPLYLSIQHHGLFSPILFMRPGTTLSLYTTSWSLLTNHIHETRDHSICLYNIMVSSHQSHTWEQGPLYLSMQHHDLFSPIPYHTWDQGPLYLSIQHHGLFSSIPYMRPVTIISVYTTSWSLLTNPIHENRDHSICLCNTMVSSHQSHTWEQGPLYLSMQHHGFFSPIPCMRTGTTLSVYTTTWSLLTNPIHENRDHPICLYNTMVSSHQSHTWEQGPLYLSIQLRDLFSLIPCMRPGTTLSVYSTPWSLLTNSIHETRKHSISLYNIMVSSHQLYAWDQEPLSLYTTSWSLLTNYMHETRNYFICLYNTMVSSHQSHTWDQGPLYLSIQHHGLFSPIICMRPGTTLSLYTTSWSLLTNPIHENRGHSICLQHHGLFSPTLFMRPWTTLSVYTTSWSLLTNPIHETRDHSICLYNTMVSSHQLYSWDHGPLYLSIQHHGLFSLIPYMRPGTTLSVYNTMVSSHQLYSWDHGPLYLSIQHHGLFSPIPYMRPGTTLSVNTTSWSLLTNPIHENRNHFICLYNTQGLKMGSSAWRRQFFWRVRRIEEIYNVIGPVKLLQN